MNRASNVAQVLLHAYNLFYADTHFIFTIFVLIYYTDTHFFFLLYLGQCLGLGLFMSYLFDLFFIFSFIYFVINHITSFKQRYLVFIYFLEYLLLFLDDNVDEKRE